jgi:uncharacterized protein
MDAQMSAQQGGRSLRALDVDECLRRLATQEIGRIAFCTREGVEVLPVNGRLVEGAIVFRTAYGDRLDDLASRVPAAYEVDSVDSITGTGWSVVVHGTTEEVWEPEELERLRALPFHPWAPGRREHFVRLLPERITGREIQDDH